MSTYATPDWYAPTAWALVIPGLVVATVAFLWFFPRRLAQWRLETVAVLLTCAAVIDYYSRIVYRLVPGSIPLTFAGPWSVIWALSAFGLFDAALVAWIAVFVKMRREEASES